MILSKLLNLLNFGFLSGKIGVLMSNLIFISLLPRDSNVKKSLTK